MDNIILDSGIVAAPVRKIKLNATGWHGAEEKRATVYAIPGYNGPELAIVEYPSPHKEYQPKAYTVYEVVTGRILGDSSGLLPLPLVLLNSIERAQGLEKLLTKRRQVGTGPHAKYKKAHSVSPAGLTEVK